MSVWARASAWDSLARVGVGVASTRRRGSTVSHTKHRWITLRLNNPIRRNYIGSM